MTVSLNNDNMVNYTFTTDQGWRVTEYRPFSASYAVLHSPCVRDYQHRQTTEPSASYSETVGRADAPAASENLVRNLTDQQLRFSYFSADVLRQLLAERVILRDRNRSSILGRLGDVSGEIYGVSHLQTPDADKQKQSLEKTRHDLERQLREEDTTLWRDTVELRRELVLATKQYDSTQLRTGIFGSIPLALSDDEHKGQGDPSISR